MRHGRYANSTELSKYIWQPSNQQTEYSLSWTILKRTSPYINAGKRCNLCIAEACHILPWPKKLKQARKPNIGACMLDRSRACATCARLSQFFLARVVLHADKDMALNKRSELVSTCRHQKSSLSLLALWPSKSISWSLSFLLITSIVKCNYIMLLISSGSFRACFFYILNPPAFPSFC